MKLSKKAMSICAIAVGAVVLTTSALADAVIGSGYFALKSSIKNTSKSLASDNGNFTAKVNFSVKMDDKNIYSVEDFMKFDAKNLKSENNANEQSFNEPIEKHYNYQDKEKNINKSSSEDKYNVYYKNQEQSKNASVISDPFDEEMANDAENIIDAFVGNLKDLVQVEDSNGSKIYTGNLTETQVPTLVNAVTSFGVKYGLMDSREFDKAGISKLDNDIHLVEVSGKAVENADGIIVKMIGTGSLKGKDENGQEHTLFAEVAIDITDIGTTAFDAPALNDENSVKSTEKSSSAPEIFTGSYKNVIAEAQDKQVVKKGEIVLNVISADGSTLNGTITETYVDASQNKTYDIVGKYDDRFGSYIFSDNENHTCMIQTNYYGKSDVHLNVNYDVDISDNGYSHGDDYRSGIFARQFD